MRRVQWIWVLLMVVCAAPAAAQGGGGTSKLHGRVFVWGDAQQMTAKESFEAVTGSSSLSGAGVGLEVHRVWRKVFLRAATSKLTADGQRVFVFDGTVFPLGIPLEVSMRPVEIGAGWRFSPVGKRLVPYLGAGVLWMKYNETTSGDSSSEAVRETWRGAVVFGGVDVQVWRAVSAGAEVAWRSATVKDPGGVFAAFGEDSLGGASVRVLLSIGR